MPTPVITPLPAAPTPADAPDVFATKAGAFVTAQTLMVPELNASFTWVAQQAAAAEGYKNAAATSATAAGQSATAAAGSATAASQNGAQQVALAAQQVTLAGQARQGAETAANQAQIFASAAGAAAGLPALAGNAGKALVVKQDESGVEYSTLGLSIGDVLPSFRNPGPTFLKSGAVYLQSSYPELFAVTGILSDGAAGVSVVLPTPAGSYISVAYLSGVYVVVYSDSSGQTATAYRSTDNGASWTTVSLGVTGNWLAVNATSGRFVITGANRSFLTSVDGASWTASASTALTVVSQWSNCKFGNGNYVIISSSGVINISSTGSAFSAVTNPGGSGAWNNLVFENGYHLAVSSAGTVIKSTNGGASWSVVAELGPFSFRALSYGNGLFMTIGTAANALNQIAATSADGTNWSSRLIPTSISSGGLAFGNGVFASLSGFTSKDGEVWTAHLLPTTSYVALTYGAQSFFMLGSGPQSARMPVTSYDQATQFYIPSLPAVSGLTQYVKAKVVA